MELSGGLWSKTSRMGECQGSKKMVAAASTEGSDKEMRLGKWLRQVGGGTL